MPNWLYLKHLNLNRFVPENLKPLIAALYNIINDCKLNTIDIEQELAILTDIIDFKSLTSEQSL